jgi:SAM-dependent methyltransferase
MSARHKPHPPPPPHLRMERGSSEGGHSCPPISFLAAMRSGSLIYTADLGEPEMAVIPPHSQDAVTMWCVIAHVPKPETLLSNCVRLLKPGGIVAIDTPNPRGLFRRLAFLLTRLSRSLMQAPLLQTLGAGHIVWYSPRGIAAATERMGLHTVNVGGSRNYTRILLMRWSQKSWYTRWVFQLATIVANYLAIPLQMPNRILGAWMLPHEGSGDV